VILPFFVSFYRFSYFFSFLPFLTIAYSYFDHNSERNQWGLLLQSFASLFNRQDPNLPNFPLLNQSKMITAQFDPIHIHKNSLFKGDISPPKALLLPIHSPTLKYPLF
jgi:hypothetical protein